MNPLATYKLKHFVDKAANSNAEPKFVRFRKYVKIGFVIAPLVAWFIWAH